MLKSFLSLFLQSPCPLCDRNAQDILCSYCHSKLELCRLKNYQEFWQGELPLFAWGFYGSELKRIIATFKYENHPELGQILGQNLAQAWLDTPQFKQQKIIVVPIPMHPKKKEKRGFNQAELIAQSFCQLTRLSCQPKGLARLRETEAMYCLNPTQRQKNLVNAFGLGKSFRRRLPSAPVLLLDDIYTTGTTAQATSQVLRHHGIKVIGIAAVATTKFEQSSNSRLW